MASGPLGRVMLAALIAAVLVTAVVPLPIKRRLRLSLALGVSYFCAVWLARKIAPTNAWHHDLEVIGVVAGCIAIARLVFVLVIDVGIERGGRQQLNHLPRDVAQALFVLIAASAGLRVGGIAPGSILATGTVVTAIVGLSLQETLGNLAAGLAIQMEKPIAIGEWIRLDKGDVLGRVVETNWRSVTIQTDDRALFVIPNGVFSKTPFTNHSRPGGATRRNLYFTLPFDVPPTRVRDAILAACRDCPEVLADPAPSVFTTTYTERGITYWLRFFIADFARRDPVQNEVSTRVWFHLHRAKIAPGLPELRVDVIPMDEASLERREAEVVSDRRAAIDGVDFLAPLSDAAKDRLARRGHRLLFAPGELILRRGDSTREFYLVRRGKLAVHYGGETVTLLEAGDCFGEIAMLTGRARVADVVAEQESEVFQIDEALFREVIQGQPEVAQQISRIVAQRQEEADMRRSGVPGAPSENAVHGKTQEILAKLKELFGLD
jgi:small-conductance mechanosensitive channel/CRP-like cAMP-binding protein